MKIILFLLMLLSPLVPDPDPECTSDWYLMWEIPNCPYCDDLEHYGTYSLYSCEVIKFSDVYGEYKTTKFKSECVYGMGIEVPPKDVYAMFFPTISNSCPDGSWLENGNCVILIPPVTYP